MNLRYRINNMLKTHYSFNKSSSINHYSFYCSGLPASFKWGFYYGLKFCHVTLSNKIENEPSGIKISRGYESKI